jgi:hypothetical protein
MRLNYRIETTLNWGGEKYVIKCGSIDIISLSNKDDAYLIMNSLTESNYLDITGSSVILRKKFRARFNTLLVQYGISKPLTRLELSKSIFKAGIVEFNFEDFKVTSKELNIKLNAHSALESLFKNISKSLKQKEGYNERH